MDRINALCFLLFCTLIFEATSFRSLHYAVTRLNTRNNVGRMSKLFATEGSHFDYLVIGGGSGGVASARRAASYGAKVGLFEASRLGGTCVNVGCVPKKVMFNAATIAEVLHGMKHYGFESSGYKFNWNQLKIARDKYIARLNGIYGKMLTNNKVEVIDGYGKFIGEKKVQVGNNVYTAENICIAVGGKPSIPKLPGVEYCITSDHFFQLTEQPKDIAIIGGGYIGVEIAGLLQSLGTQTDLIIFHNRPLAAFDETIAHSLMQEMKKQRINIHTNQRAAQFEKDENGKVTVVTSTGERFGPYEQVLLATGRVPNLDPLELSASMIEVTTTGGFIKVDEYQTTSCKGVYAVGDATGQIALTPTAIAAGRRLADRLFGNMPTAKADYENVPTVVFSHPPIGTVGLTETQAKKLYGDEKVKVYTTTFTNLYYGVWDIPADDKPKTVMKIVTLLPQEKVLGIHVLGTLFSMLFSGYCFLIGFLILCLFGF
jgi:glutathione reductase (NADPH)